MITSRKWQQRRTLVRCWIIFVFRPEKAKNKTLIEIRTAKDCRLDAVIESVSYPFFECAYSLTAEHGEEWLLRIADLHMENWKEVYMPSDAIPDEDDENWGSGILWTGTRRRKNLWDAAFIRITGKNFWRSWMRSCQLPFPDRLIKSLWNIREMSGSRRKNEEGTQKWDCQLGL